MRLKLPVGMWKEEMCFCFVCFPLLRVLPMQNGNRAGDLTYRNMYSMYIVSLTVYNEKEMD